MKTNYISCYICNWSLVENNKHCKMLICNLLLIIRDTKVIQLLAMLSMCLLVWKHVGMCACIGAAARGNVCVRSCGSTCEFVQVFVWKHMWMFACVCVEARVNVCVSTCECVCVCVWKHVWMHVGVLKWNECHNSKCRLNVTIFNQILSFHQI